MEQRLWRITLWVTLYDTEQGHRQQKASIIKPEMNVNGKGTTKSVAS